MTSNVKKYKHLTKEERDIIEFMLKDDNINSEYFNVAIYFCHKYFDLFFKEIPIREIIKKDNGLIINYKKRGMELRKRNPPIFLMWGFQQNLILFFNF